MLTLQHAAIGVVGDWEKVRRHFIATFALVQGYHVHVVDRQSTVRVDGNAEQSRVCLRTSTLTFIFSFIVVSGSVILYVLSS